MRKLALLCCVACGSPKKIVIPVSLTNVSVIAAGSECANGGLAVQSGVDKNGNGTLDASEVQATQLVCQTVAAKLLSATTAFAPGQNGCEFGGTQTSYGLDDGAGGGTAADGILQAGEIQTTTTSCNAQPTLPLPASLTPPADVVGQAHFTIDTHGATATDGPGATGGQVQIGIQRGSGELGGDVKVFATGLADATCQPPDVSAFNGGPHGWSVPASITIRQTTTPNDQEYYLDENGHLLKHDALLGSDDEITGLEIPVGVTLIVDPALNNDASMSFSNDIHIAGTLTAVAPITNLSLSAQNYVSDVGALIDLQAIPLAGATSFSVQATVLVNHADIQTGGAAATGADDGVPAGSVTLFAGGALFNDGHVLTLGGTGNAIKNGGDGGSIEFTTQEGPLCNLADLTSSAGVGASAVTISGFISLKGIGDGSAVLNSGALTSAAPTACTNCVGGSGGKLTLAAGGSVVSSGALDASGGAASTAGGAGGAIEVTVQSNSLSAAPTPAIQLSGKLWTPGGDAASVGHSGSVSILNQGGQMPGVLGDVVLFGYSGIDTHGGSGNGAGSASLLYGGGQVSITQTLSPGVTQPTGAAINYTNIDTHGGDNSGAVDGDVGGAGGAVELQTPTFADTVTAAEFVFNAGNILTASGSGVTNASPGGVILWALSGAQNQGNITGKLGLSQGDNAGGGFVWIFAFAGDMANSGNIDLTGANSIINGIAGGNGGNVSFAGTDSTNTGIVTLTGGTAADGIGSVGAGGNFTMFSTDLDSLQNGSLLNAAGAGVNQAQLSGHVSIDRKDPRSDLVI